MFALDEYSPLQRVALRHARDAFRSQAFIDASWRQLGYHAPPDYERAVAEYDAFAEILTIAGADIDYLATDQGDGLTLDAIYVRDANFLTPSGLAAARMGKPDRRKEPALADARYRALALSSCQSIAPGTVEGGDIIWHDAHTCAVAEGYRTDRPGIAALRELLPDSVELVVCPLPHYRGPDHVFHLMSICSPLDRDLALVFSPLMAVSYRRFLCDRGIELIDVSEAEFEAMACNVLALGPRRCLMLDGLPETRRQLERAGCEVMTYAGQEISRKGEGGPTCLTRPIVRVA